MDKFYVIATNGLGKRHYFAGQTDNFEFPCMCITQFIFAAYDFENKDDAEDCIKTLELGDKWEVSECNSDMSSSLKNVVKMGT